MFREIKIKYVSPSLNLGMEDIKNVWILSPVPVKLAATVHQGNLMYRWPGTGKRISYQTLKKGLIKKQLIIREAVPILPF